MEWKEVTATEYCSKIADGTHDSPKRQNFGKYLITSKHINFLICAKFLMLKESLCLHCKEHINKEFILIMGLRV